LRLWEGTGVAQSPHLVGLYRGGNTQLVPISKCLPQVIFLWPPWEPGR
jgi:hypothetical protein